MSDEELLLQKRFSEFLSWERKKRREEIMASVFFYSVVISFVAIPARGLLPIWLSPLSLPLLFFVLLLPGFFVFRRWGERESLRTLFLVDKTLHLEERAITAWEILSRKEKKAAELLVLNEAEERLREFAPRALFKRRFSWRALLAPPLLLMWLLLMWLDLRVHPENIFQGEASVSSLAQKLRDFSRDLQDRAKEQGLSESLKTAQALEEVAERRLRGEVSEKELNEQLAGMVDKIGPVPAEQADLTFPSTTSEALLDLKAELETLKSPFLRDSTGKERSLTSELRERMGRLPRLSEEIKKGRFPVENLEEKELGSLLEKLEKAVLAELDRRTLSEARDFLELLLKGGGGDKGEEAQVAGQAEHEGPSRTEKMRGKGTLPGSQPGTKGETPQTPPFNATAATHLKGILGEGKSGSFRFRGEATGGKSKISEEEIITSYRRQLEEELASERIPEALKETIKNYFLSLGLTEERK